MGANVPRYERDRVWEQSGNGARDISDLWAVAEELYRWGESWPQTTQTLSNGLLKQWVFHGSCMQTHAHKTGVRALQEGFGCLFLTITAACFHTARGAYPMLGCPLHRLLHQIFPWKVLTQQGTRGVGTFWQQGQSSLRVLWKSHNGTLLRLCSSKQISPFHILHSSEIWRSLLSSGGQFAQIQSEPFLVYIYLKLQLSFH